MTALRLAVRLLAESLAAAGVLAAMVVWPPVPRPAPSNAVVLLSGDGTRLGLALRLMEEKVAPTLLIVGAPDTIAVRDLCRTSQPYEVVCLRPMPDSTRAEARATGRFAHSRDWTAIVVVTSRLHVTRARMLFGRCFDGDVAAVGDYPPHGSAFARRAAVHEWLGLVQSTLVARGC